MRCSTCYASSPNFGPPRHAARGAKHHVLPQRWVGSVFWRDAQAGVPSARRPRAQLAFKNSMVRGILQFTPGIAFCYVLHRCESQDIRCRESCGLKIESLQGARSASRQQPLARQYQCSLTPSAPWVLLRPLSQRSGALHGQKPVRHGRHVHGLFC